VFESCVLLVINFSPYVTKLVMMSQLRSTSSTSSSSTSDLGVGRVWRTVTLHWWRQKVTLRRLGRTDDVWPCCLVES